MMYLFYKYQWLFSYIKDFFAKNKKINEYNKVFNNDLKISKMFFGSKVFKNFKNKRILFASYLPLPFVIKIEGLLSKTLNENGCETFCVYNFFSKIVKRYHKNLFNNKSYLIDKFISFNNYFKIANLARQVIKKDYEDIKNFNYKGCYAGIHALAKVSANAISGKINLDERQKQKVKRTIIRSCLLYDAYEKLFKKINPEIIIAMEKGFPGTCEIFYYAINNNIDYIQWVSCHEPDSIMLKRYNKSNMRMHPVSVGASTWETVKNVNISGGVKKTVIDEFVDGYTNNKWFKYKMLTDHSKIFTKDEFIDKFKLDKNKKIAVIFSHVLNDANLFYGEDLFKKGFTEWLQETIKAADKNDNANWILKLHPANIYKRGNLGYTGEYGELLAIKESMGYIPKWLKIIYPDENINPLSIFKNANYSITVRGTIGAEVPCFGNVVLTAGTGRYSGLGFTNDSDSKEEYLNKIINIHLIPKLTNKQVDLAIMHAYLFFKIRPAKINSFIEEINKYPNAHPFYRDIIFKSDNYKLLIRNTQLNKIIDYIINSDNEDFLANDKNILK